jgi:hypothetical protein
MTPSPALERNLYRPPPDAPAERFNGTQESDSTLRAQMIAAGVIRPRPVDEPDRRGEWIAARSVVFHTDAAGIAAATKKIAARVMRPGDPRAEWMARDIDRRTFGR